MSKRISRVAKTTSTILRKDGLRSLFSEVNKECRLYSLRALRNSRIHDSLANVLFRQKITDPKIDRVYLELTNNCNLRCEMCTIKKNPEKIGYMSRSLFESCIDQLSQIGVRSVLLHGVGESLLHPNFKDYLKYAISRRNEKGIREISWSDNGMLFNQSISNLVVDLKVDEVLFSIDGVGEVNDRIRLGAKYSIIEQNIKYLIKKRGNAPRPRVFLDMVDHGKTEEQKMEVYREWAHIVDGITLMPSLLPDNSCENKSEYCQGLKLARPPDFCSIPFDMMMISWDGKVSACCLDWCYKIILGNATRNSLRAIWQGSRYQALRKAAIANSFPIGSPCERCDFWKLNFEPREESILDGTATMKFEYVYKKVKKNPEIVA
jgi:radical SAM protein with 4Fe4S-binding SPASM domain